MCVYLITIIIKQRSGFFCFFFKKSPHRTGKFFHSVSKVESKWNKWSKSAGPACRSEEEEEGLPGRLHFVCCLCWPQLLLLYCCFPLGACDGLSSTMVQHEQQPLSIPSHPVFDKSSVFLVELNTMAKFKYWLETQKKEGFLLMNIN